MVNSSPFEPWAPIGLKSDCRFLTSRAQQVPPQVSLSRWKITSKVKDIFSLWCVFLPSDQKFIKSHTDLDVHL